MTRKIILIICAAFTCTAVFAQNAAYDRRFRFQTSLVTTFPMGSFSNSGKENSLLGHATTNLGGESVISVPVYHGFTIGAFVNYNHFSMRGNGVLSYLQSRYASNDYFITWPGNKLEYDLTQGGIECAQNFRLGGLELEPYIRLVGIGFHDGYSTLNIRRKRKGDNYEEQISMSFSGGSRNFFYPSLGMRANFRMFDYVYLVSGFQLMAGTMHTEMQTVTTDIFGGRKTDHTVLKQKVTAFQLSLGLQFRVGKRSWYPN